MGQIGLKFQRVQVYAHSPHTCSYIPIQLCLHPVTKMSGVGSRFALPFLTPPLLLPLGRQVSASGVPSKFIELEDVLAPTINPAW